MPRSCLKPERSSPSADHRAAWCGGAADYWAHNSTTGAGCQKAQSPRKRAQAGVAGGEYCSTASQGMKLLRMVTILDQLSMFRVEPSRAVLVGAGLLDYALALVDS